MDEEKPMMEKEKRPEDYSGAHSHGREAVEDNDRWIWDEWELKKLGYEYQVRFKGGRQKYGIRARKDGALNTADCLGSLFMAHNNEWVMGWLALLTFLFFFITFFCIWAGVGVFGTFKDPDNNIGLSFYGDLLFMLSSGLNMAYVLFYSIGPYRAKTLEILNFCGAITVIYYVAFIVVWFEYDNKKEEGAFQTVLAAGLVGSYILLGLVDINMSKWCAFAMTGVIMLFVIEYDYNNYAEDEMKNTFYHTICTYIIFFCLGAVFYILNLPERCCNRTRFCYNFLSGHVLISLLYTAFFINLFWLYIWLLKNHEGSQGDWK